MIGVSQVLPARVSGWRQWRDGGVRYGRMSLWRMVSPRLRWPQGSFRLLARSFSGYFPLSLDMSHIDCMAIWTRWRLHFLMCHL